MDTTGLLLSIVSTITGVIGVYFSYVAVRRQLTRRRTRLPQAAPHPTVRSDGTHDVYVSYGHEDADWVREFAQNLHDKGLRVAYDEVVSTPGGIRVHATEAAIRAATHGVLVFSPASLRSGWVEQEYAALMQRSIEGGRRFIPVVVGDVELPEFAATRYHVDFRSVRDREGYERRVDQIAQALRDTT